MANMDPKLVAKSQQYEVAYFAKKHRISAVDARERAGRSREKATRWRTPERNAEVQSMQRFFFHVRDGQSFVPDEEGVVLANMAEARVEAVRSARDILADQLREGKALDGQEIEITDAAGEVLETLAFKDALRPDGTIH